jgi:hypothetical protein
MVITWYGKNCFKLQSGDLVLVTDPFEKEKDLTPFRGRADIIIRTITFQASGVKRQTSSETFEISYPGEYEVKNVGIKGWPLPNSRSIFLVEMDGFKIILLGHLANEDEISARGGSASGGKNIQEYLEEADILFIPAIFAKLVRQLKPSLVIPTLFEEPKDLKPFLKELGKNEVEPQEKLTISKKDLSKEKLIIGCLKV